MFERVYGSKGMTLQSYTDYKYMIGDTDMPGCFKLAEQKYLYEGLVTTYPVEVFKSQLREFEDAGYIQIIGVTNPLDLMSQKKKTPVFTIIIDKYVYDNKDNDMEIEMYHNSLMKTIQICGYFIAQQKVVKWKTESDEVPYDVIMFEIHPKYIIEVTPTIYDEKRCNGIVYHITTKNNLKKIEEKGLIPRNKQFFYDDYPDRVYLFPSLPPDNFEQRCIEFARTRKAKKREILIQAVADYKAGKITKQKLDYLLKNRYDYREWVVLKIDLKDRKVYRDDTVATSYRFFDDPKAPSGIFTYENIDPYYIKLPPIAEFTINDTDDFEDMI